MIRTESGEALQCARNPFSCHNPYHENCISKRQQAFFLYPTTAISGQMISLVRHIYSRSTELLMSLQSQLVSMTLASTISLSLLQYSSAAPEVVVPINSTIFVATVPLTWSLVFTRIEVQYLVFRNISTFPCTSSSIRSIFIVLVLQHKPLTSEASLK